MPDNDLIETSPDVPVEDGQQQEKRHVRSMYENDALDYTSYVILERRRPWLMGQQRFCAFNLD